MTALKIIALILGSAFTSFGYLIVFKKKYSLINGFEEAFREGRKSQDYAKTVGLVELLAGIALLIGAILLMIFA